jgi:hypothetical protein
MRDERSDPDHMCDPPDPFAIGDDGEHSKGLNNKAYLKFILSFPFHFIRILFWNKPLGPNPPPKLRNPFFSDFLGHVCATAEMDESTGSPIFRSQMQWWCTCDGAPRLAIDYSLLTQPLTAVGHNRLKPSQTVQLGEIPPTSF